MLPRNLSDNSITPAHDSTMFSWVGKCSLGGIDVAADGSALFVMNLYDRTLYRLNLPDDGSVPTASDVTAFPMPGSKAPNSGVRPFAVKCISGKVLVGVVNDAQATQRAADLKATVYSLDPVSGRFETLLETKLDYPRGTLDFGVSGWRPWTDDYNQTLVLGHPDWMIYPQPILADIEVDTDGSLILGFMDRLGHQTGGGQYYRPKGSAQLARSRGLSGGDVLRVAWVNGQYRLEQNGQAGSLITAGRGNGQGPGGGEFYFDDSFGLNGTIWHHETATGGLAMLPDQGQLIVAAREPVDGGFTSGGMKAFDNRTGRAVWGQQVFPSGEQPGYFWKTNNVGDVEVIGEIPPTMIASRVWQDVNGNGQQEADEPGLGGVEIHLYKGDQRIGMTTSSADGAYELSSEQIVGGLRPRTQYTLRVALKQSIGQLLPALLRQGADRALDSDGIPQGQEVVGTFTTTAPGEPIHDISFGFQCLQKPSAIAQMRCTGNNAVRLSLSGGQSSERFSWIDANSNQPIGHYGVAQPMPNGEASLTKSLSQWPDSVQVRVWSLTGCYTDQTFRRPADTYCSSASLQAEPVAGLRVTPNPTVDEVQIHYISGNTSGNLTLQLTDSQGRVLQTQTAQLQRGTYQTSLRLGSRPAGTYIVTITDNSQRYSRSVIRL
ncbi:SdrD B-like domain-containing protein [uncultured Fibrella sp.]|uniref:SdrD B-like domain-containing protein n=1 Tax=uncultured Fibrella sp. TaxID=1284596 RepID=UPI0035C9AD9D